MPFGSKPLSAALSIVAIAAVAMASSARAQQDPPSAGQQAATQSDTQAKPPENAPPDGPAPAASAPTPSLPGRADAAPPSIRSVARPRIGAGKSAVVTANVNLRSGPGTDSDIIATIPAGSAVRVAECSGQWCAVTWNGRSGYAIARNLGPGAPRQAGGYPPPPGYAEGYEPPVVYGAPGYYAPPAVVYGPAYYYGPRVYYGPGWRRHWW